MSKRVQTLLEHYFAIHDKWPVVKVMKRRCYGLGSVESYFQRLWLDLKGYDAYGF